MDRIVFRGIMPALVSPVNEDGTIREAVTRRLVKDLSKTGITGFYLCGATGEGVAMAPERRMELVEIVRDSTELKLIDHVAATDLATAKRLAAHARKSGMDGLASVPPFFYGYGEKEIIEYYRALSDASEGLPLVMYACPLAGAPLPASTIEKMLDIPGFVGLKYTNPNYFGMWQLKQIDGGNINIINGPDETLLLGLTMGADGGIGSTYNLMPRVYVELYNAFQRGDMKTARAMQEKSDIWINVLTRYRASLDVHKIALEMQGYDVGRTNAPLPRASEEERAQFIRDMEAIGFPESF